MHTRDSIDSISFKNSNNSDNDLSFQSTCIELKIGKQKAINIKLIYRSLNQDSKEIERKSIEVIGDIMNK